MRTAAEESGPQDYKFTSTGYEPNDYFLTETFVEFKQESVTEQRFPEDLDYDDAVIGQTLFNAYRRRVDHSEGEGLSSGPSSELFSQFQFSIQTNLVSLSLICPSTCLLWLKSLRFKVLD